MLDVLIFHLTESTVCKFFFFGFFTPTFSTTSFDFFRFLPGHNECSLPCCLLFNTVLTCSICLLVLGSPLLVTEDENSPSMTSTPSLYPNTSAFRSLYPQFSRLEVSDILFLFTACSLSQARNLPYAFSVVEEISRKYSGFLKVFSPSQHD